MSEDWGGSIYFRTLLINEEIAYALENNGAGHVCRGASGGLPRYGNAIICDHDPQTPWMVMDEGPDNHWLESLEGNCTHCGCMARLHIMRWAPGSAVEEMMEPDSWRVRCKGCDGACQVMPPHADWRNILRRFT